MSSCCALTVIVICCLLLYLGSLRVAVSTIEQSRNLTMNDNTDNTDRIPKSKERKYSKGSCVVVVVALLLDGRVSSLIVFLVLLDLEDRYCTWYWYWYSSSTVQ